MGKEIYLELWTDQDRQLPNFVLVYVEDQEGRQRRVGHVAHIFNIVLGDIEGLQELEVEYGQFSRYFVMVQIQILYVSQVHNLSHGCQVVLPHVELLHSRKRFYWKNLAYLVFPQIQTLHSCLSLDDVQHIQILQILGRQFEIELHFPILIVEVLYDVSLGQNHIQFVLSLLNVEQEDPFFMFVHDTNDFLLVFDNLLDLEPRHVGQQR